MMLCNEGSFQAYWLDGCRSDPVAGSTRGRDLDFAAANKRSAANCSKKTLLQRHRPLGIRWSLSVVPQSLRCAGDREAGHHCSLASRGFPVVLALEVETPWWPAEDAAENMPADPRDEYRQSPMGRTPDSR